MPRNGSGTYSLPEAAFVPGATISSAAVNDDFSDIAAALTDSVAADGQTSMTGTLKAQAGSAANPGYAFVGDTTTGFYDKSTGVVGITAAGVDNGLAFSSVGLVNGNNVGVYIRIGMIMDWAGNEASVPSGWFLCAGQVLSSTTYPILSNICGTAYNTGGEGAGNFRLPDLRGRGSYGKDDMNGSAAGRITNAVSGIAGTTLGATGGNQGLGLNAFGLHQSDLPNTQLAITGTTTPALNATNSISGHIPKSTAAWAGIAQGSGAADAAGSAGTISDQNGYTPTGNVTVDGSNFTTASMNGGVAQTVPPVMNPAIMLNKIIFAGHA